MITLNINNSAALSEGALYGINLARHFIDSVVVATCGALGCLITGLLYGVFSNWGFLKKSWIAVKWLLSWGIIITGSIFYLPFIGQMRGIITMQGLAAMKTPFYIGIYHKFFMLFILHMILLIVIILLSTIKPKLEIKIDQIEGR